MTNEKLIALLREARASVCQHKERLQDCDHDYETCTCDLAAKKIVLLSNIDDALDAYDAAPAAQSKREDGTFEVVPPLSEKSPPWHRVSMAVTEIVEREGYFGCVLVGFKQKPDAWDVEAMVDSAPGLNVESVRPEMLVAALTIVEKLRDQTIRYYLAKNRETEGDSAPKETK
jgi:hypothetical protein